MGNACCSHLSTLSQCCSFYPGSQILSRLLAMEMAPTRPAEETRQRQFGLPRVGPESECRRPISSDAHHNARLSSTKFNVQRVHINADCHARRVQTGPGHFRGHLQREADVG
uniref:Uncharacterized protein n=1 Tax=Cacopsylla melanoneura TaxID=428564 RepID=A0A8D8QKX6_9HEMI